MPVAITGSAMVCCFGDANDAFDAMLDGRDGARSLRIGDPRKLKVANGYHVENDYAEQNLRASRWLTDTVCSALRVADIDPADRRVAVVVGTGLRESRSIERWHGDGAPVRLRDLHFGPAIRAFLHDVTEVHTISGACAASGQALGLAMDMLDADEADAVVAAGCDAMSESMLAAIGRMSDTTPDMVRPFDDSRGGVLLGEGAAAVVLERPGRQPAQGMLRGVGMTCDARHETAPDLAGVVATIREAHERARVSPEQIDLVVAHGTGTALNDPTEAAAMLDVFGPAGPLVTGIKGAIGHTSGAAAVMSLLIALAAMRAGVVPPIIGLRDPIPEARDLRLVHGRAVPARPTIAQVNAFGFGGLNAVAIVEAPHA